jgi:hypothetical protein
MTGYLADRRASLRMRLAAGLWLALAALPVAAAAEAPADLYYERALMSVADGRCRLFTPEVASALGAAEAQARGAALRAGASPDQLRAVAARAAGAASKLPCRSPDLQLAAARVRQGFDGYSRLLRMTFPGDVSAWRADRSLPVASPVWRLSQDARLGRGSVTFGLAGDWNAPAELLAVGDFGSGPQPYAARLVVRDPTRAPEPYLNALRLGASARLPLSARVPPPGAARVFSADDRALAGPTLAPGGAKSALAFSFPAAAVAALADLDPREAVSVAFLFQGPHGDIERTAFIEVGDFAAGRAFLAAARR